MKELKAPIIIESVPNGYIVRPYSMNNRELYSPIAIATSIQHLSAVLGEYFEGSELDIVRRFENK